MVTLPRGGPIVWISENDAKKVGIVDNDWIEAYNSNGALVARAVGSQRVKDGMCLMYHAQEKIVNVPGTEITGQRAASTFGDACRDRADAHDRGLRPAGLRLHLPGTIGTNRDEFIVRKMRRSTGWISRPPIIRSLSVAFESRPNWRWQNENRRQIAMAPNLEKCIGCHTCSVTWKNVWTNCEGMEYAWFNNVETKPGIGYRRNGRTRSAGTAVGGARRTARSSRASARNGAFSPTSSPTRSAGDRRRR